MAACPINSKLINLLEPQVQLRIYSYYNFKSEVDKLVNQLGYQSADSKTFAVSEAKAKEYEANIKSLESKLTSIIELLEANSESNSSEMNYHIGKKILEETDFNLFIEYVKQIFNSLNYYKASNILSAAVKLIELNIQSSNISSFEFSTVKILCLWYLICVGFLQNDLSGLTANLNKIYQEINILEKTATDQLTQSSFYEQSESMITSMNSLKQIISLKGYLLNWSILKFKLCSSKEETADFYLSCESFLDLCFENQYSSVLPNFDYITPYLIISNILTNKDYRNNLVELISKQESSNPIVSLYKSVTEDLCLDEIEKIYLDAIKFVDNDFFLSENAEKIKSSISELIIKSYIDINCSVDLKKISKFNIGMSKPIDSYIEDYISLRIPNSSISSKSNDRIIYEINESKENLELTSRMKNIQSLSSSIISYLKK